MDEIKVKYPRTLHLPWSPGVSDDDKVAHDLSTLTATEVVITVKMDGENCSIYPSGSTHARSLDAAPHPSRSYVRSLAARVGPLLPAGWRVCGENLYARHSIGYDNLADHFLMFSIFGGDRCLSWDATVEWAALLDLQLVPVLYRGPMPTREQLDALFAPHRDTHEGYVVRVAEEFKLAEFATSCAKWVRDAHVQTSTHWMNDKLEVNGLARQPG